MSCQRFIMNVDPAAQARPNDARRATKDKLMSYEEKSVGSTAFFKCEACPYMALAEDDIKFHLFTAHPELARSNGLADNVQILCPGCASVFDAEETLRNHLRNHHKMGIKDVKKMVKSLVQLALKDAKLKKENDRSPPLPLQESDVKIPQVIEIIPDIPNANNESLPKGVAFISVEELQKMSTPNFEKVDPKEIIQEASINIVYTNPVSTQYVNVSNAVTPVTACNVLQMSNVPPDLISSIQPRITIDNPTMITQTINNIDNINRLGRPAGKRKYTPCNTASGKEPSNDKIDVKKIKDPEAEKQLCSVNNCRIRLKNEEKLAYHRKCHFKTIFKCPECAMVFAEVDATHTHLWKTHEIDMEMPTCEICGFKTYKRSRFNQHMKCHGDVKAYACSLCPKTFKNANQLSKHRTFHKAEAAHSCALCPARFHTPRRLRLHTAAVHHKLRPFRCCHCDYTAARKDELKVHLRSHTGDKPYSCDSCGHRAADHNAMRRHRRLHSKDAAYTCKHCAYSCIQAASFAAHMLRDHPEAGDVHRCRRRRYTTVSRDHFRAHQASHPAAAAAAAAPEPADAPARADRAASDRVVSGSSEDAAAYPAAQPGLRAYLAAPAPPAPGPPGIVADFPIRPPPPARGTGPIILPAPAGGPPAGVAGTPRKKPKISVKSNLILKGPDQENMFHSRQKMAFERLEDSERFGLGAVTFNNLITTQFMLRPQPAPAAPDPRAYPPPPGAAPDLRAADQLFPFDAPAPAPEPRKPRAADPGYIKLEATVKQNTQSPSLERMAPGDDYGPAADGDYAPSPGGDYAPSPGVDYGPAPGGDYGPAAGDAHKSFRSIKNEVKSDAFYGLPALAAAPPDLALDAYLPEGLPGEQYLGQLELAAALAEAVDARTDVIEIDDTSDDNKLLSRYDFPLESLYLMHNDFHFLESEGPAGGDAGPEVPVVGPAELPPDAPDEYPDFVQGKRDPMMNTSVRQCANKINVKNIELMKDRCKDISLL